jgi:hypothetical protein
MDNVRAYDEAIAEGKNNISVLEEVIKEKAKYGEECDTEIYNMNKLKKAIENDAEARAKENIKIEETEKKIKEVAENLDVLSATFTKAFGILTLVATAVIAVTQAYDNAIKSKREVIYTLGRMGMLYGDNAVAMTSYMKELEGTANKWGMLKEDMAKSMAPLTGAGVGAGMPFAEAKKTLTESAEWMGGMLGGLGIEMGLTARTMTTLSTSMDIGGKTLSDTFANIVHHGEKSVLGAQRYITELTNMVETTRRFGGTSEGAIATLGVFGEEVKKGTIGIADLARVVTPAMWSLQQQGAVVSMMQQFAPGEAKNLGITPGMDLMTGMVKLQEGAAKGGPDIGVALSKIIQGITPKGASEGTQAVMAQQLLQQLTGVQVPLLKAAEALSDPTKMKDLMKGPEDKQKELLTNLEKSFKPLETWQQKLAGATDTVRDILLKTVGPASVSIEHGVKSIYDFMANKDDARDKFIGEKILGIHSTAKVGWAGGGLTPDEQLKKTTQPAIDADKEFHDFLVKNKIPDPHQLGRSTTFAEDTQKRRGEKSDIHLNVGDIHIGEGKIDIKTHIHSAMEELEQKLLHQWDTAQQQST